MDDENDNIEKFLESIPDKFDILNEGIDIKTQKEYIDYSHSFERGKLTEKEQLLLGNMLFDAKVPLEGKKKAICILAHLGNIFAFRQIEKYYQNPDKPLKHWSALALQECKMFLESDLTGESMGFISSGLGGTKDRLRYYFLILPASEKPFTATQSDRIKEELTLISKNFNSIIESFNVSHEFIGLTVLIPLDVAVGPFIESGIKNCNESGDVVFEHYYVTNTDIPDQAEIVDIIRKVKDD